MSHNSDLDERVDAALSLPPSPLIAQPTEPAAVDEDDVPAEDSWAPPLRKPVPFKSILTPDDYYALLRILEVLPVADPFLTALQAKLSDDMYQRLPTTANHLSGTEFVREIERVEALIQARVAPLSAQEPATTALDPDRHIQAYDIVQEWLNGCEVPHCGPCPACTKTLHKLVYKLLADSYTPEVRR